MTIQIETGIPMPGGKRRGVSEQLRVVLQQMQVGDSFKWDSKVNPKLFHHAANSIGFRVATQKEDGYYRVWRKA